MKKNFDKSLEMLLHHEGGYVNHPKDPGGETNLGVTRAVYEQYVGRQVMDGEMKFIVKCSSHNSLYSKKANPESLFCSNNQTQSSYN